MLILVRCFFSGCVVSQPGIDDIAVQYGVTIDMAVSRYNTTGIAEQVVEACSKPAD